MPIYLRSAGGHVAERIQPEPGSEHETELAALAADPESDWREETTPVPVSTGERPADSALKDEWIAYAVFHGADPAEAKASKKQELIDTYGKD